MGREKGKQQNLLSSFLFSFFFFSSKGFEFLKDKGTQGLSEQTVCCEELREHLLLNILTPALQPTNNMTTIVQKTSTRGQEKGSL